MRYIKKISILLLMLGTLISFASCSAKDFFGDYSQYEDGGSGAEEDKLLKFQILEAQKQERILNKKQSESLKDIES